MHLDLAEIGIQWAIENDVDDIFVILEYIVTLRKRLDKHQLVAKYLIHGSHALTKEQLKYITVEYSKCFDNS